MGGKVVKVEEPVKPYHLLQSGMMEYDGLMLNEKRKHGSAVVIKENKGKLS